jgi:hypothetical protein
MIVVTFALREMLFWFVLKNVYFKGKNCNNKCKDKDKTWEKELWEEKH